MGVCGSGPSGDHLGQIILPRLSAGQIDGGKDIFCLGLLRIKPNAKEVRRGVIRYFHDTLKSVDGGAHGVGAAASHKPALLYYARHPKIYAGDIHGEFSVYPGHPASALHPARLALRIG